MKGRSLQYGLMSRLKSNSAAPIMSEVLRSNGRPLNADTRVFIVLHFGEDFSQVFLHIMDKKGDNL